MGPFASVSNCSDEEQTERERVASPPSSCGTVTSFSATLSTARRSHIKRFLVVCVCGQSCDNACSEQREKIGAPPREKGRTIDTDLVAMGNDVSALSCTSRGRLPRSFDEGFDQLVDGVEQAAEYVENAIDATMRTPPARPSCDLSDNERSVAMRLFWQLVRYQGGEQTWGKSLVFEDAAMSLLLQRVGLLDPVPGTSSATAGGAPNARELAGEPAPESMLRKLHAYPIGRWLKADAHRRCYTPDEWMTLTARLLAPQPLIAAATIPQDNPLPISSLVQLPQRGLLICSCANDSTLDRVEHLIDGPTNTVAGSCSRPHATTRSSVPREPVGTSAAAIDAAGAIRPMGALLVWRWPPMPAAGVADSRGERGSDGDAELVRRAMEGGGGGGEDGSLEGAGLLQAFTPLAEPASCLAYCVSRALLLVGTASGAIQFFTVSQRGALHYRYAIQAHPATVVGMCLRPHPVRCDKQVDQAPVPPVDPSRNNPSTASGDAREGGGGGGERGDDSDGPWTSVDESELSQLVGGNTSAAAPAAAPTTPPPPPTQEVDDDLLISVSDAGDDGLAQLCSAVFAYDLRGQYATPLVVPLDERVTAVATEELGVGALRQPPSGSIDASHHGGRLFLGTIYGGVVVASLVPEAAAAAARSHPKQRRAPPSAAGPFASGGSMRSDPLSMMAASVAEEAEAEAGPAALELIDVHRKAEGHDSAVSALRHCAARNILCSGARDGTVCVWALAARGLQRSTTRLLGRLVSGPSRPVGAVISLHAVESPSGGAPRVIAAGSEGAVVEWDLHGGKVTRAVTKVPYGVVAHVADARQWSDAMAIARGDGVLQLWRWPSLMRTAHLTVVDDDEGDERSSGEQRPKTAAETADEAHREIATSASGKEDGSTTEGQKLPGAPPSVSPPSQNSPPPPFVSIRDALASVGGLPPPPSQAFVHHGGGAARYGKAGPRSPGAVTLATGQRTGRIKEFVQMPSEAEQAAIEADPFGAIYEGGVARFVADAETAFSEVADALEDAVGAALGGPSATGEFMARQLAQNNPAPRPPAAARVPPGGRLDPGS